MASIFVSLFFPIYLSYRPEWRLQSSISGSSAGGERHKMSATELFQYCLQHPALLAAFKEYCIELWCAENIQFYLEVQDFKNSFEDGGNPKELAERIRVTFLERNSPNNINIDDSTQKRLLEALSQDNITVGLFDEAEATVEQQMRHDTFSKFKLSGRLEATWKKAGLGDLAKATGEEEEPEARRPSMAGTSSSLSQVEKDGTMRMSETALELLKTSDVI